MTVLQQTYGAHRSLLSSTAYWIYQATLNIHQLFCILLHWKSHTLAVIFVRSSAICFHLKDNNASNIGKVMNNAVMHLI